VPVRSSRKSSTTDRPSFRLDYDPAPRAFARTLAMERICALFVGGAVPFDAPLSERAIAETVGLGRMPVREALRELAGEGIVSVEPGRGTYLRQLDAVDVTELLEVRLAIEGMGARLAAEKGFVGDLPGIVLAVFFAWRMAYYGFPFPNTYYVKTGGGPELWRQGWEGFRLFVSQPAHALWIAGPMLNRAAS